MNNNNKCKQDSILLDVQNDASSTVLDALDISTSRLKSNGGSTNKYTSMHELPDNYNILQQYPLENDQL